MVLLSLCDILPLELVDGAFSVLITKAENKTEHHSGSVLFSSHVLYSCELHNRRLSLTKVNYLWPKSFTNNAFFVYYFRFLSKFIEMIKYELIY